MEQALKPEAQGNVAVEPVADLIERLTYRVNNPSAWDSFDDGASELIREAASSIASLSERLAEVERERDDALSRVDELESEAETVSAEFEGDCWKAMRSLLTACKFSWRDVEPDGVSAEDAREYIATTLDEIEKGETRNRERAEAAEHQNAELRANLAEAREIIEPFAKIASEYSPREDDDFNIMADKDVLGEKLTLRKFRRARAFRDATSEGDAG